MSEVRATDPAATDATETSGTVEAPQIERVALTDAQRRARRNRSVALGIVLAALVGLFYAATVAKLGGNIVGIDAIRDL